MRNFYKLSLLLLAAGSLRAQTTTFSYTGAVQTYTVPACVTSITIDAYGAQGGNDISSTGGLGGRVQATIAVTPGEVLQIFVGQAGVSQQGSHPGVFNGGGGVFSYSSGGTSGTGGGGTDIRRSPYGVADRLVVAGGGGGGGYQSGNGGHGGGLNGVAGTPFPSWPSSGGQGGTQSAGGSQGVACCSCPTYTTPGTLGLGGNGAGDGAGGGGGGGGYYGGGGSCFAGGGGGSSYAEPSATAVTHTTGSRSGNGELLITAGATSTPAMPTNFAGNSSVCEGSSATYSVNTVANATSYTWTVPAGATITSGQGTTTITVTFGSSSGNIAVTADNACGSGPALTQSITVNPVPVVALGNDITQCEGTATLDAGNPGATYFWSTGEITQTINVMFSGTYTATVVTTSGCSASDAITVMIHTNPTVTLGSDITQCGGTALLDAGNAGATFLWNDASTNQTLTVSSSGTYSVTVTDANGCSNSDAINVTINALPNVTASAANTLPCVADGAVALTGSPAGGSWAGPGVSGNSFDPATAGVGTHNLVYTFTDSLTACTDTAQVNVTVDICLGITNDANGSMNIFPNPATDVLQVRGVSAMNTYSVVDVNGRVVLNGSFSGAASAQIDVSALSAGTYMLQATDKSGVLHSVRFTKK